jgi:hypothetical protein
MILHFILFFFDILFAKFANVVGVHSFGGKLAILFVNIAPFATISAILTAFEILFDFETMIVRFGENDLRYCRNWLSYKTWRRYN